MFPENIRSIFQRSHFRFEVVNGFSRLPSSHFFLNKLHIARYREVIRPKPPQLHCVRSPNRNFKLIPENRTHLLHLHFDKILPEFGIRFTLLHCVLSPQALQRIVAIARAMAIQWSFQLSTMPPFSIFCPCITSPSCISVILAPSLVSSEDMAFNRSDSLILSLPAFITLVFPASSKHCIAGTRSGHCEASKVPRFLKSGS